MLSTAVRATRQSWARYCRAGPWQRDLVGSQARRPARRWWRQAVGCSPLSAGPAREDADVFDASNKSLAERLKHVMKRYGTTAVLFHSSVYVLSYSSVFLSIHYGLDAEALLKSLGAGEIGIPAEAGEFAAAWAVTAISGPPRGLLTVVATPLIARRFGT